MDQEPLRAASLNPATGWYEFDYNGTNGYPIRSYFNPGDGTAGEKDTVLGRAVSGYAANLQVFGYTSV
jgi:hypothetical protein